MVDKLIERDGGGEGSADSNKDGEKDPSLVDSIMPHPRGKKSFFPNTD